MLVNELLDPTSSCFEARAFLCLPTFAYHGVIYKYIAMCIAGGVMHAYARRR